MVKRQYYTSELLILLFLEIEDPEFFLGNADISAILGDKEMASIGIQTSPIQTPPDM